jgi:hypothetical protein
MNNDDSKGLTYCCWVNFDIHDEIESNFKCIIKLMHTFYQVIYFLWIIFGWQTIMKNKTDKPKIINNNIVIVYDNSFIIKTWGIK